MTGTAATGKTNLPVRDMPMTVQSVPGQVIREQGANDSSTALQNVPGVYAFTNYGIYEGYTFRGFLDLFPSLANQLVDGVRHEGNRINTQLTNIERIEVLKGPSSALYGGGAIGATVNLIRKKPSAQPAYDFSAGGRKLEDRARHVWRHRTARVGRDALSPRHRRRDARKATATTTRGASRCHAVAGLAPRRERSVQRLLHVQPRSLRRRCRHSAAEHRTSARAARERLPRRAARPELPDAAGFRRRPTTTTCRWHTRAS